MFKYTQISAASWIPTVSEDNGHKVPLAKLALSLQTQLTCPEEYAVMVNGSQPDLSMSMSLSMPEEASGLQSASSGLQGIAGHATGQAAGCRYCRAGSCVGTPCQMAHNNTFDNVAQIRPG